MNNKKEKIKARLFKPERYSRYLVSFSGGKIDRKKRREILRLLREQQIVHFSEINVFAGSMDVICSFYDETQAEYVIKNVLIVAGIGDIEEVNL